MDKKSSFNKMRPKDEYEKVIVQREIDGISFCKQYASEFVEIDCPACGNKGENHFTKYGFQHKLCEICDTIYCSPRPSENLLEIYYNSYQAPKMWTELLVHTDDERKKNQYQPRADQIIKALRKNGCRPGGVALDLGAGGGTFALCLKETGFFSDVICLDFSEVCVEVCKSKGLHAISGDISSLELESLDLITMNDLIEHVFDPFTMLQNCRAALKPEGFLSVATPNGMGFDFILLKEKVKNITPPEHLTYFNTHSLNVLFQKCDFNSILIETPGRLDTSIIKNAIENGLSLKEKNEFLHILFNRDDKTLDSFQEFISKNLMSSHMFSLAQKKEVSK